VGAGAAWWLLRQQSGTGTAGTQAGAAAAIRSAKVSRGGISRTIRLTGSTGAERYAALLTPRLGGRGGDTRREGGREFRSQGVNTGGSIASNSGGGRGGFGGGGDRNSSSSTSSSASTATGPTVTSTMGQSRSGGSSAFQSATSRVNRSSGTQRSSTSSSSGSTGGTTSGTTSSTTGTTGSSGGSGGGGGGGGFGGGGGGGGDFQLVLQKLTRSGTHVGKGDVVAEFDRVFMLNRVEDFRSSVAQTDASFIKLKAELEAGKKAHQQTIDSAKADLDKAQLDIKTIPVQSAMEAERLRLALEEAQAKYKQLQAEAKFFDVGLQAQLRNAQIEVEQARIDLRRAEANADRMVLKAPIDGLLVVQNTFRGNEFQQIQEGDQLWPGMQMLQIVDASSMVVNAMVNQADVERLRIGAKAKVRFDAFPDLELPAHVYSIAAVTRPGGNRGTYVKEIPVRLKLDGLDPRVIPDLSVSADVEIESLPDATIAPLAALFTDDGGKTSYAFVRNGEVWDRRTVRIGLRNRLMAAVESGLRPGEVVALERPPDRQNAT
jgi:multidrug resistance efflux pump